MNYFAQDSAWKWKWIGIIQFKLVTKINKLMYFNADYMAGVLCSWRLERGPNWQRSTCWTRSTPNRTSTDPNLPSPRARPTGAPRGSPVHPKTRAVWSLREWESVSQSMKGVESVVTSVLLESQLVFVQLMVTDYEWSVFPLPPQS